MSKNARTGRARLGKPAPMTRQATIEALLTGFGLIDGLAHPALAAWPEGERQEIFEAAQEEFWTKREAAREPVLIERLATTGPEAWGECFAEMPHLREQLSPEQRERWDAWLASRR